MAQAQATDCISQINVAERKIADYNANWNIWDIEYKRLEQEIINKEKEINIKDVELHNWVLLQLQNNKKGVLIKRGYEFEGREGCGNWPGNMCHDACHWLFSINYLTPRGRKPSNIAHYFTYKQHCKWELAEWETYRCYCEIMNDDSHNLFFTKRDYINELIKEKTTLQNTISTHAKNMPQFPPIIIRCCDKVIECDNKVYGPNSCYGNLQICKQSNYNILDKSRTTELETSNRTKILKIKDDLNPIINQINELNNTVFNLTQQLRNSIDNNNITNSILNVKNFNEKLSLIMTQIETIRNINNIENEAKELFNYITADTTHKREMQSIFEIIKERINTIQQIIKQARSTFSDNKIIYETLLNEELNLNLLKIEQNKIIASIKNINDYLDSLKIMNDTVNSLTITSQEDIDKLLEIYNKAIILVKNINLEIKNVNDYKNELTNIYNKFTINSFLINNVKEIYKDSITKIENILKKINDYGIDNIIEKIYSIFLKNKNIYEASLLKLDEEKLKIIQDEELNKLKIINKIDNIIIKNDIKQEEASGINITYIIIGIAIVIISLFLFIKK